VIKQLLRLKGLNPNYYDSVMLAKKYGGKFKTVIDVGASIGEYSEMCRYVFPVAKIYAFEPNQRGFKELKKRNLTCYNYALTDQNKEVEFNYDKGWDSTSSLLDYTSKHKRYGHGALIKVKGIRFDNIDIKIIRPCFVKIDVEGAEKKVLAGFGEKLKEVDVIQVELRFNEEYDGQSRLSEIAKLLEDAGFRNFVQDYYDEYKGCDLTFFKGSCNN